MIKDTPTVDWTNPGDILHYYNNPEKYPNATEMLSRIPSDMYIAATCVNIVESKILGVLESNEDNEIEFLMRMSSKASAIDNTSAVDNTNIDTNIDNVVNDNTNIINTNIISDNIITDNTNIINTSAVDTNASAVRDNFYIKNLGKLLKPFVPYYLKNIANLVLHVKKKTGMDYTEILYGIPTGTQENVIEWYLIMSYLSKKKDFDMKDIQKILEKNTKDGGAAEEQQGKRAAELNFFESGASGSERGKGPEISKISEIGSPPLDSLEIHEMGRPFEKDASSSLWICLEKTKKEIFAYQKKEEKFYSRALATFLSIKFDREIFRELLATRNIFFCEALSVLENPPFFFFRDASIQKLLYEACRYPPRVVEWIESGDIRTKTLLHCNSCTLEQFIQYSNDVFDCINSFRRDWLVLSIGLIHFLRRYQDLGSFPTYRLFPIFSKLKDCRIEGINVEVTLVFMENISLIMRIFYNDMDDNNIDSGTADSSTDENTIGDIPKLDDPESILISAFNSPEIYEEMDIKRSKTVMRRMMGASPCTERREVLESYLLEKSEDINYQKYILMNLEILEKLPGEISCKMVRNIVSKKGLDWRIGKMVIESREVLMRYGMMESDLEGYKSSKIRYIREMMRGVNITDKDAFNIVCGENTVSSTVSISDENKMSISENTVNNENTVSEESVIDDKKV